MVDGIISSAGGADILFDGFSLVGGLYRLSSGLYSIDLGEDFDADEIIVALYNFSNFNYANQTVSLSPDDGTERVMLSIGTGSPYYSYKALAIAKGTKQSESQTATLKTKAFYMHQNDYNESLSTLVFRNGVVDFNISANLGPAAGVVILAKKYITRDNIYGFGVDNG